MADQNTTDAVSRRNVLKTAGGLLAGATLLAGQAAGDEIKPLNVEIEELTEEYVAVRVSMSEELYERVNERGALPERVFLGLADDFVVREDTVSHPENATEVLARPVEMDFENPHDIAMYFRTEDIADGDGWPFSEVEGEEVTLGLGVFPERTVPDDSWDTGRAYPPETSPEL